MEFDPKIFEEIKKMEPEELSKKIEEISALIGVDSRRVKRMMGDTDTLAKKLENLSEDDIKRMSKKIDKQSLEDIRRSMDQR